MPSLRRNSNTSSKCYFSPVEFVWLFIILIALILSLTSLVTGSWLDKKWSVGTDMLSYSFHRRHGLWKICWKIGNQKSESDYVCENRFKRTIFETGNQFIDNILKNYHDQKIEMELACLVVMSISVVLTFMVIILFSFLHHRCIIVLSMLIISAFGCSLTVLVLFTLYHLGGNEVKDSNALLKFLVSETINFGYSYWLAVVSCFLQFVSGFGILFSLLYVCCKRYSAGYR